MAANPILKAAVGTPPTVTRPSQADFARFLRGHSDEAEKLVRLLADGSITPTEFGDRLYAQLSRAHTYGWAMGRQRAGDLRAKDIVDELVGISKADMESDWIAGFVSQLESGWALDGEGNFQAGKVLNRTKLYVGKVRGTAGEAFVEASSSESEFDWVLGGAEKHCGDCPQLAALSPWSKDTLFQHPGDGNTPCLANCKCHLKRDDGMTSFKPVRL